MLLLRMDLNSNMTIHSVGNINKCRYSLSFCRLDFKIKENDSVSLKSNLTESWFNFDMSPLRVWLEHSVSPLIHVQYVDDIFTTT